MDDTDKAALSYAKELADLSKDPRKKVGCVILNTHSRILGTGYNRFPRGIADTEERWADREYKNRVVVHAEVDALINCYGQLAHTLYCTSPLCCSCASLAIMRGVQRVVMPQLDKESSWYDNCLEAVKLLDEAGVVVDYVEQL
jgi:dCMP deaminase